MGDQRTLVKFSGRLKVWGSVCEALCDVCLGSLRGYLVQGMGASCAGAGARRGARKRVGMVKTLGSNTPDLMGDPSDVGSCLARPFEVVTPLGPPFEVVTPLDHV